jgi:large subunit ribosomal protein L24
MMIKKGDKVKVLSGKDKGKTGTVLQVFPDHNRASVEGINVMYKNMKPRGKGEKGQRIQFPAPLVLSKLAVQCPKCGKPTRLGTLIVEGKKMRTCKKCKETI